MANKELASLLIENNIVKKQKKQGKKINALLKSETKTGLATNITDDLGDLRIGNLLCAASGYPDDGTFTGTFISLEGFTINGTVYHIGGMKDGQLMWAGNSTTGEFMFINGNAVISIDGIIGTELLRYLIAQTATGVSEVMTGKLGVVTGPGSSGNPVIQLSLESEPGAEQVLNGGFETGDETNWTDADSKYAVDASYLASDLMTTIYPYEGNYLSHINGSTNPGGDTPVSYALVSDYFNISGANLFSARYILEKSGMAAPVYTTWADFNIKFYTAGSALVSTITAAKVILSSDDTQWKLLQNIVQTPATATKAKISIEFNYISPDIASHLPHLFIDDVSCKSLTIGQGLWVGDDGIGAHGVTDYPSSSLSAGTYTPTTTAGANTNVGAVTFSDAMWTRIGNVVHVAGYAMLDPTADANTILSISLPIASNFTAASDCAGTGKVIANNTTGNGSVYADATNDLALLRFAQSGTTSNTAIVYHFTYLIK